MKKPELLAPVGSKESLIAAINAGCDAVYLSGYMFGARKFAPNFSDEELKEAITICHIYGVKVYVTVNTLIKENEVSTFLNYIDFLHQNNVDAVIMQDLGMIDLVRQTYPNLEIHASTQLHIHNLEGVKFCEELGIKRVVLARETNIELIKKIREKTNIELEVFVHGALCVSYSGQCLMSSLIGGRSGNRGACAGTCRLPYTLLNAQGKKINNDDYVLSMKDLCTLENIKDLIESGVDSFKIEGRMKRPEYVYLVVTLYRKAIDSYFENGKVIIDESNLKELKKVFNRKFTKGFLFDEDNSNITNSYRPNHLGIEIGKVLTSTSKTITVKLNEDLNIGDGIRIIDADTGCTVTTMYKNNQKIKSAHKGDIVSMEFPGNIKANSTVVKTTDIMQIKSLKNRIEKIDRKIELVGNIKLFENQNIILELTDGINKVSLSGSKVEKAISAPLNDEQIEKQLKRLGETPFVLKQLNIEKDDNIYVNNKDLNEVRRFAIEKLIKLRTYQVNYLKSNYYCEVPNFKPQRDLNVLLEDSKFYQQIKDYKINNIYSDDLVFVQNTSDSRIILKLPRVINEFVQYDYPLMIGEIGSLSQKKKVVSDFSFNVTNSYTLAFLHSLGLERVTLSYELEITDIENIVESYIKRYSKKPNIEVIIYAREEMMVSKFSLNKLYNEDLLYLADRFNNNYSVKEKNNLMYIYNYKPRSLDNFDMYYNIGVNALRINLFDTNDLLWFKSQFKFIKN